MEYARHPFDTLLTYETWLENNALISKSFIKKKKKKKAEIILTRQLNDLFYWSTVDLQYRQLKDFDSNL